LDRVFPIPYPYPNPSAFQQPSFTHLLPSHALRDASFRLGLLLGRCCALNLASPFRCLLRASVGFADA
jgi:hypothetical protein